MGVRPLRRVVEQQIRDKVTDFHLDHLDAKHLEAVWKMVFGYSLKKPNSRF